MEGPVSEINRLTDKMLKAVDEVTARVHVKKPEGGQSGRTSRRPSVLDGVPETGDSEDKEFLDL